MARVTFCFDDLSDRPKVRNHGVSIRILLNTIVIMESKQKDGWTDGLREKTSLAILLLSVRVRSFMVLTISKFLLKRTKNVNDHPEETGKIVCLDLDWQRGWGVMSQIVAVKKYIDTLSIGRPHTARITISSQEHRAHLKTDEPKIFTSTSRRKAKLTLL